MGFIAPSIYNYEGWPALADCLAETSGCPKNLQKKSLFSANNLAGSILYVPNN